MDEAGQITLKSWLEYPVKRVRSGMLKGERSMSFIAPSAAANKQAEQVPALFDFSRQQRASVILGQVEGRNP